MLETSSQSSEQPTAWQAAEAEGFDMSVVAMNLEKSPWERLLNHGRALATAMALQQAMKDQHAGPGIPA